MRSGPEYYSHSHRPRTRESSRFRSRVLAFGAVGAAAAALALVGPRLKAEVEDFGRNVADGVGELVNNFHSDSLNGQPVEGTEGDYETQNLAGGPFAVYKGRNETEQLGVSFPDQRVKAKAFLGVIYPSNSKYAKHEESDGQEYGWWYQVDALPIYEQTKDGEYAFKDEIHGGWVKVDFLTRVQEAADNLSDAQ